MICKVACIYSLNRSSIGVGGMSSFLKHFLRHFFTYDEIFCLDFCTRFLSGFLNLLSNLKPMSRSNLKPKS